MIYFALVKSIGYIKIGSAGSIHSRLNGLRSEYGDVVLLGYLPGELSEERTIQRRFAHIKAPYQREFFLDTPELRDYVLEYARADLPKSTERQLRTSPQTRRALRMYAGRVQADTGRQLSDDETVQHILDSFAPDLMEKARSSSDEDVPPKPLGRKPKDR